MAISVTQILPPVRLDACARIIMHRGLQAKVRLSETELVSAPHGASAESCRWAGGSRGCGAGQGHRKAGQGSCKKFGEQEQGRGRTSSSAPRENPVPHRRGLGGEKGSSSVQSLTVVPAALPPGAPLQPSCRSVPAPSSSRLRHLPLGSPSQPSPLSPHQKKKKIEQAIQTEHS